MERLLKPAMKNRTLLIILLVFLFETIFVGGMILFGWMDHGGILEAGLSAVGLIQVGLLGLFCLFLLVTLISGNFRAWLEDGFANLTIKYNSLPGVLAFGLVLLLYEGVEDILFLQSDTARIHYQGYFQLLSEFFPLLVLLTLFSLTALVLLLLSKSQAITGWFSGPAGKRQLWVLLSSIGFVFLFHLARIGTLPGNFENKWFEELNAPLLGLQVLGIALLISAGIAIHSWLRRRSKRPSRTPSDLWMIAILLLFAFLSWYGVPPRATTFTDVPRPPNYENYPRSDALGYQISAHDLLAGNGTGRDNHVGFWHSLSLINLITGSNVTGEYLIWLLLLTLLPALVYLITSSLSSRLAGLLAAVLVVLRESNSIALLNYLSIPQLRDRMTEPLTMLGLLVGIFLFVQWAREGKSKPVYLITAGGALGWVMLLRIEGAIYAAAVGVGLLLLTWKSRRVFLKSAVLLGMGVLLVAGPWFFYQVNSTGSLAAVGMGKTHLLRRTPGEILPEGDEVSDKNGIRSREALPYNLANNIMTLVYYLPSNHQPLLTVDNLPDLALNQVDSSDLEGDTYREKYLERYVRSIPYWWNGWDGRLPPRAFLPLALSVFLVLSGFFQLKGERKKIALILAMMAGFHVVVYAYVGKSGGRFIQVVDWIPLVFYGIGLSGLLVSGFEYCRLPVENWWVENTLEESTGKPPGKFQILGVGLAVLFLLLYGLSYPLTEEFIPARYSDEEKTARVGELSTGLQEMLLWDLISTDPDADWQVRYGRALYPRFFEAGESLSGDNPKGRYTDITYDRVAFYLVGSEDVWVALPTNQIRMDFPHAADVLILGTVSPRVRFGSELDDLPENQGEYFKAARILFLEGNRGSGQPPVLDCSGTSCEMP